MTELKPCPFCGGKPITDNPDLCIYAIYCDDCGAYLSGDVALGEDVSEMWNKRAS